jgi:hypothetical protein
LHVLGSQLGHDCELLIKLNIPIRRIPKTTNNKIDILAFIT